jgi:YHS domain-containing protein
MKVNHKMTTAVLAAALLTGGVFGLSCLRADDAPATQPSTMPAVAAKAVNTKCPISGDPVDSKVTTVYDGKTYAFCCSDCIKAFKKDPAKYAAAAK